jgi:thiol-disulfide isomerase/thioredoxin
MDSQQPDLPPAVPEPVSPPAASGDGRPSRKAAWIGMGAVVLALTLLTLLPQGGQEELPPPAADATSAGAGGEDENAVFVGKAAPLDFTLKDMNGVDVRLATFKGKVILLNFWATWCGPCKAEIPGLVELQAQYKDDLVVLGFSVDDTVEKLQPYVAEYRINYPVLIGNGREDVQDAYGPLWGIPVSVIIGRDGTIAKKHSGIASKEQFEREIKALL